MQNSNQYNNISKNISSQYSPQSGSRRNQKSQQNYQSSNFKTASKGTIINHYNFQSHIKNPLYESEKQKNKYFQRDFSLKNQKVPLIQYKDVTDNSSTFKFYQMQKEREELFFKENQSFQRNERSPQLKFDMFSKNKSITNYNSPQSNTCRNFYQNFNSSIFNNQDITIRPQTNSNFYQNEQQNNGFSPFQSKCQSQQGSTRSKLKQKVTLRKSVQNQSQDYLASGYYNYILKQKQNQENSNKNQYEMQKRKITTNLHLNINKNGIFEGLNKTISSSIFKQGLGPASAQKFKLIQQEIQETQSKIKKINYNETKSIQNIENNQKSISNYSVNIDEEKQGLNSFRGQKGSQIQVPSIFNFDQAINNTTYNGNNNEQSHYRIKNLSNSHTNRNKSEQKINTSNQKLDLQYMSKYNSQLMNRKKFKRNSKSQGTFNLQAVSNPELQRIIKKIRDEKYKKLIIQQQEEQRINQLSQQKLLEEQEKNKQEIQERKKINRIIVRQGSQKNKATNNINDINNSEYQNYYELQRKPSKKTMTMLIKPSIVNMQKINQANQRNLFEASGIIESDEQENQSQQIQNQNQEKNLDQFPQFKNQKSPQQQNQQDQFLSPNLMKEQIFEFKQKMIESMQFNQSLTKSQEFEQNNQENGNENTLNNNKSRLNIKINGDEQKQFNEISKDVTNKFQRNFQKMNQVKKQGFSNYLGQDAKLKFLNVFNQDQQDKKGSDKNKNQKGKKNQEQVKIQDLSFMAEKTVVYLQGIKKNILLGQYIMDLRKQHQQKKLQQANDQISENEKSDDLSETFNLPEKLQINLNTPKLRNMTQQIIGNKSNLQNAISPQNSPIKQKSKQNEPTLSEYEQMLETCKNFLIFTQNINQEQEQNKYFLEEINNYDKFEKEENEKKKKNKKLLNNYLVEQVRKNIEKTNLFDSGENQESSYLQINKNNNNKNNNVSQNNIQSFSQQENLDSINKSHEKNNSYMKNSQKKSEQQQQQQSFSSSNYSNQYAQQYKTAKKAKQENQEKYFFKNYFGNCDSIQQQYNNIIGKCKILAIIKAEDYFQIKYSFLKQSEQIIGLEKALLFLEGIESVRYNIVKDYYIMAQLEESHEIKGNLSRALIQHLPRLVKTQKQARILAHNLVKFIYQGSTSSYMYMIIKSLFPDVNINKETIKEMQKILNQCLTLQNIPINFQQMMIYKFQQLEFQFFPNKNAFQFIKDFDNLQIKLQQIIIDIIEKNNLKQGYTKEEILDLSTFSYLAKTFFSKYDTFNYEDIQLCIQQQIEKKQIKRWGYIFDIQIKGFQKVLIDQAKLQKSQAQIISQNLWSAVVDQIILA